MRKYRRGFFLAILFAGVRHRFYSLFSLAVRILFGLRVPHITFVLKTFITGWGCKLYSSSLPNASKPTNNLSHFPRRHLASLSNHFVKVLHLHEHILLSSLNITLYICQINFSIYFYSHQHIYRNKPTLPNKHCSWELSLKGNAALFIFPLVMFRYHTARKIQVWPLTCVQTVFDSMCLLCMRVCLLLHARLFDLLVCMTVRLSARPSFCLQSSVRLPVWKHGVY